jgi:hypothetical protein
MVSCTQCINHGVECHYVKESVSCTECVLKHRTCDITVALEESPGSGELGKEKERQKERQKADKKSRVFHGIVEALSLKSR